MKAFIFLVGIVLLTLIVSLVYLWSKGLRDKGNDILALKSKYDSCMVEKDDCDIELSLVKEELSSNGDKLIVDTAKKCSEKDYDQILSDSVNFDGSISLRTYLENSAEPNSGKYFIHAYRSNSGEDCVYDVTNYLNNLVATKISKKMQLGYAGINLVGTATNAQGSESKFFYVITDTHYGIYISDLSKPNDLKVVSKSGALKWHGDVFITDPSISAIANSKLIYVINIAGTGCESEESCKDFEKAVRDSGIQDLKGIWIYDFVTGKSKKVSEL